MKLNIDSLLGAPASAPKLPALGATDAAAQRDTKLEPRPRAEALAALRASSAEQVAVWDARSPRGVAMPRADAIARIESAKDEKVVVAELSARDRAAWAATIDRATAEQVRAEWFAGKAMDDADTKARAERLTAERDAELASRRRVGDSFYQTLLGDKPGEPAPKPADGSQK